MRIYKKIITGLMLACMLASAPAVDAAPINSLPYSDNFDSYADEKHTTSFDTGLGNTGVAWFYLPGAAYNPGDILYLCDDDDTSSGHGKVVKYSNNTSLVNTRMQYRFPKQTSGKILFKCDIKVKNDSCPISMVPCTTSYSDWTGSMVKFENNSVSFYTAGEKSDYAHAEWNTVACLINLDDGTQTVYFKDKAVVTQVPNVSNFAALTFYWHSKGAKMEGATDVVYIDNVEIRTFSGDVKLMQGANEVTGSCLPQNFMSLVVEDDEFVDTPYEVKLTDYGLNPIECLNNDIPVTADIVDGKMLLTFAEDLKDGHNYKLVIAEGSQTKYSGTLDELVYEFAVGDGVTSSGAIKDVLFENADGTYTRNISGSKIKPETKSVEIYFSDAQSESALAGISISSEDEAFVESRSYNSSKKCYKITFTNLLKAQSEYTLSIPAEIAGSAMSGKFITDSGKFKVGSLMFLDEDGYETNVFSKVKNIAVNVVNTAEETKSYNLVGVGHAGFALKGMYTQKYDITSATRNLTMLCPIALDEGVTEIKGFLWSNILNAVPQNSGIVINK